MYSKLLFLLIRVASKCIASPIVIEKWNQRDFASYSSDDYVISLWSTDSGNTAASSSTTSGGDKILSSESDQTTETETTDLEVSRMNMDQSNRFFSTEPQPAKPRHEARFVHIPGHIGY